MTVTSGPRRERIIRNGLFMLMCVGMGGYFAYDGWIGYPAANFDEYLLQLPVDARDAAKNAKVYAAANLDQMPRIAEALDDAAPAARRNALEELIGGPPSHETDSAIFYFGQDGLIKIEKSGDRLLARITPIKGKHTLWDFQLQKLLGVVIGGIGVVWLVFLVRVARTRAAVTDAGLSLNGKPPIQFEAMKSLDTAEFRRKGRVYLECGNGDGRRVLLDEYHLADFDKIMAAICERAGFEDPVALERAEKAKAAQSG